MLRLQHLLLKVLAVAHLTLFNGQPKAWAIIQTHGQLLLCNLRVAYHHDGLAAVLVVLTWPM